MMAVIFSLQRTPKVRNFRLKTKKIRVNQGVRAMKRCQTKTELKSLLADAGRKGLRIGFVPTMGALHPGHASLIVRAKQACDFVVVSVFVNPTQFNNSTDFETYPSTLEHDMLVAHEAGADVVFTPNVDELYEGNLAVEPVDYGRLTSAYEGQMRKGHFDGVVAVVRKLFLAVQSDEAFFGEKDLQQLAVIRRLAHEEFEGLKIVGCPLIREVDGLAMSSRNVRLVGESRQQALALFRWLNRLKREAIEAESVEAVIKDIEHQAAALDTLKLEYVDVIDGLTFESKRTQLKEGNCYAVIAAEVAGVRLIDNCHLSCS